MHGLPEWVAKGRVARTRMIGNRVPARKRGGFSRKLFPTEKGVEEMLNVEWIGFG